LALGLLAPVVAIVAAGSSPVSASMTAPPKPDPAPGMDKQSSFVTTNGGVVTMSFPPGPTLDAGGKDVGLGGAYLCGELGCINYYVAWELPAEVEVVTGCTAVDWNCSVRYHVPYAGEPGQWSILHATFGRGSLTTFRREEYLIWGPPVFHFIEVEPQLNGQPLAMFNGSVAYAVKAGKNPNVADCAATNYWQPLVSTNNPDVPDCVTLGSVYLNSPTYHSAWHGYLPVGTGPWVIYPYESTPTGSVVNGTRRYSTVNIPSVAGDTYLISPFIGSGGSTTTSSTSSSTSTSTSTTTTTIPTGAAPPPPVLTAAVVGSGANGATRGTVSGQPGASVTVAIARATGATCPRLMSGSGITSVGSKVVTLDSAGKATFSVTGTVSPSTFLYGTATISGATSDVSSCLKVPAGASGLVVPPFTSLAAFVQAQSTDVLGRAATAAEQSAEIAALKGGARPGSFVESLRRTADGTKNVDPVTRLYFAYFLRIPDKGGLTYWIRKRRAGSSLTTESNSFAGSNEFKNRYGSLTNRAFVNLVYTNVLGRAGEKSGVDYWTRKLDTHAATRGQVMLGFSESHEYVGKKAASVDVAVTWIDMIGAAPDKASFDAWVAKFGAGSKVADLADTLLGDARYAARHG
jgi:hypothetical protein